MTSLASGGIVSAFTSSPAFGNLASSARPAVARRVERGVFELAVRADGAQQQAAAGHVAHAGERGRKAEAAAEQRKEDVDVLAAGDGAEKHDLGVGTERVRERGGVEQTRLAVVVHVNDVVGL